MKPAVNIDIHLLSSCDCVCLCMNACMYVCMHVSANVCMYVRACVCVTPGRSLGSAATCGKLSLACIKFPDVL